jgi:uncharacterized protein YjbI with pentapeptide repeats
MAPSVTTLTADEVKHKLKNGEAVEGVTLERITLAKSKFTGPVILTECQIEHLDLNGSTFQGEVILRRCKIRTLILSGSTFEKICDLKKSTVHRIRCQEATFQGGFHGSEATLAGSFHKSIFVGKADFGWSRIHGDATFTEVQFQSEADFRNARIEGNGIFEKAHCRGAALFCDSVIEGDLRLRNSVWERELNLSRSQVKLGVDMTAASLGGVTDMRDMTVGRTINLNRLQLGPQQGFRFMGLVASTMDMQRKTVEGHVHPEQEKKYWFATDEYGFLRVMFQKIHRYEDEDWAYFQYKRMERKSKPLGWNPLRWLIRGCNYLFLDLGCGYGTRPFRTLLACALMVIFFAFLYLGLAIDHSIPVRNFGFSTEINQVIQAFDYSLTAFSGSYSELPFEGGGRILAMIEYMLGVVFLGLFVVALSRKVIR